MENFKASNPLNDAGVPAFFHYDPNSQRSLEHMKEFISKGNPVLVRLYPGKHYPMNENDLFTKSDREGHVVNVIGYDDEKRIVYLADPWDKSKGGERGGLTTITYDDLILGKVNCTRGAMSVVTPFQMKIEVPSEIAVGEEVVISAAIHYTKPRYITTSENHIHALHANISLPKGLSLVRDKNAKRVDDGYIQPSEVKEVKWLVRCEAAIDSEVKVTFKGIVSSMDPYAYSDIVGGELSTKIKIGSKKLEWR